MRELTYDKKDFFTRGIDYAFYGKWEIGIFKGGLFKRE